MAKVIGKILQPLSQKEFSEWIWNSYDNDTGPQPSPEPPKCPCGHILSLRPNQYMSCEVLGNFQIILEKCPNENGLYHKHIYTKILQNGKEVKIIDKNEQ